MESSLGIVAYLALFLGVAILFLFANLLIGRLVRPDDPHQEKLEIYECGEPTIGSSFVQFDLRFYVVALLFIIFDVEIAFFFPWATVFGKLTNLADPRLEVVQAAGDDGVALSQDARLLYQELGIRDPQVVSVPPGSLAGTGGDVPQTIRAGARQLALVTLIDIGVFFAVLLIGFAYVWKRGDLDWVRAVGRQHARRGPPSLTGERAQEQPVLSA